MAFKECIYQLESATYINWESPEFLFECGSWNLPAFVRNQIIVVVPTEDTTLRHHHPLASHSLRLTPALENRLPIPKIRRFVEHLIDTKKTLEAFH